MTPDEIKARLGEIQSRMVGLDKEFAGQEMPEAERDEFKSLVGEREELEKLEKELRVRRELIEKAAEQPESREAGFQVKKERVRGEDVFDLSTIRMSVNSPQEAVREMKERAKYAIEQGDFASDSIDPDEARGNAEKLLKTVDRDGALARRYLETGSPTYQRAFGKVLLGQEPTPEERTALGVTGANGGYAVPYTLDPTVIHTSTYSVNPFRAISRVIQITATTWNGVSSAGISAAYAAEATEASDNSPTLVQPTITPVRAQAFVPYSIEIDQDWMGLQAEITSMISEAKDDLEASKFFGGSGTNEPYGVSTGATATLNTAATATFAVADVYSTEVALPPRYRPRAEWIANRAIYNRIRQFDTAGGAQLWTENLQRGLANQVPTPGNTGYNLLSYPTNEVSTMGTSIATGGTIAILGDFSKFVIVDRVGMNVELIPHLFGSSNRYPTGQRAIYAIWRNGSKVVDGNAFRKLLAL